MEEVLEGRLLEDMAEDLMEFQGVEELILGSNHRHWEVEPEVQLLLLVLVIREEDLLGLEGVELELEQVYQRRREVSMDPHQGELCTTLELFLLEAPGLMDEHNPELFLKYVEGVVAVARRVEAMDPILLQQMVELVEMDRPLLEEVVVEEARPLQRLLETVERVETV
jgi:hypothetical protein